MAFSVGSQTLAQSLQIPEGLGNPTLTDCIEYRFPEAQANYYCRSVSVGARCRGWSEQVVFYISVVSARPLPNLADRSLIFSSPIMYNHGPHNSWSTFSQAFKHISGVIELGD